MDCRGVFDALDKSESSALGMRNKRSAMEALALKRGMPLTKIALRWCHSGAQIADGMTKDSKKARRSFQLCALGGKVWWDCTSATTINKLTTNIAYCTMPWMPTSANH